EAAERAASGAREHAENALVAREARPPAVPATCAHGPGRAVVGGGGAAARAGKRGARTEDHGDDRRDRKVSNTYQVPCLLRYMIRGARAGTSPHGRCRPSSTRALGRTKRRGRRSTPRSIQESQERQGAIGRVASARRVATVPQRRGLG